MTAMTAMTWALIVRASIVRVGRITAILAVCAVAVASCQASSGGNPSGDPYSLAPIPTISIPGPTVTESGRAYIPYAPPPNPSGFDARSKRLCARVSPSRVRAATGYQTFRTSIGISDPKISGPALTTAQCVYTSRNEYDATMWVTVDVYTYKTDAVATANAADQSTPMPPVAGHPGFTFNSNFVSVSCGRTVLDVLNPQDGSLKHTRAAVALFVPHYCT